MVSILYLIIALYTFGRVFNDIKAAQAHQSYPDKSDRFLGGLFAAVGWPLYWPGVLAIRLTRRNNAA